MNFNLSSTQSTSNLLGGFALASTLLMGSISAHAMLPTPEPELNNPSSIQNAQAVGTNNTAANIETRTVAALVSVDSQGRAVLQPVSANTRLRKGNVIEYHSYFTNKSTDRVGSMDVYMSIPNEVKLLGEVAPNTAEASIDGTNFNHMPLRGRIGGELKEVPLEYYKSLRWTIEGLGVDETAVVKYRALVR